MLKTILIWVFFIFLLVLFKLTNGHFFKKEPKLNVVGTQHKLKVLTKMQAPFVMFDPKSGYITGIDVLLLKTIAKKLNLQLEFKIMDDSTVEESYWEYVLFY